VPGRVRRRHGRGRAECGGRKRHEAPGHLQRCKRERIGNVRVFGWGFAHGPVSRRSPISLATMVARTVGYAYDAGVWDLSIIQGPVFCVPNPSNVTIRSYFIAVAPASEAPATGGAAPAPARVVVAAAAAAARTEPAGGRTCSVCPADACEEARAPIS
jgi:hypothetical protein